MKRETSKLPSCSESVSLSESGEILEVTAMRFSQCGLVGSLKQDNLSRDAHPMESQLLLKACVFRVVTLCVIERQDAHELASAAIIVNPEDQASTSRSASFNARKVAYKLLPRFQ